MRHPSAYCIEKQQQAVGYVHLAHAVSHEDCFRVLSAKAIPFHGKLCKAYEYNKEDSVGMGITPGGCFRVKSSVRTGRIFYDLCILKYFVNIIGKDNDMTQKLQSLLAAYPNVDTRQMGFPDHWEEEPLWKN